MNQDCDPGTRIDTEQCNRIYSPEMYPMIYGQLIFSMSAKKICERIPFQHLDAKKVVRPLSHDI